MLDGDEAENFKKTSLTGSITLSFITTHTAHKATKLFYCFAFDVRFGILVHKFIFYVTCASLNELTLFKLIRFEMEIRWKLRIHTYSAYEVMKINDIDIVVVAVCVEVCSFFAKVVQWVRYSSHRYWSYPPNSSIHYALTKYPQLYRFAKLSKERTQQKCNRVLDQCWESDSSISILNHKYFLSRKREEIQWNNVYWRI